MSQIATSINQSKTLIDLGIYVNTADMYYYKENIFNNALAIFNGKLLVKGNSKPEDEYTIPAWSLSALLELMPDWYMHSPNVACDTYCCRHIDGMEIYEDNPLDAAFEMVCYLLENKLI